MPASSKSTGKRKASSLSDDGRTLKKRQLSYYPPEMTNQRAFDYIDGKIPRPIDELENAIERTQTKRDGISVRKAVIFWFKSDLRIKDNHGLYLASKKAKEEAVPLVCMYIVSPEDLEAHLTSPARVDFIFRSLAKLAEKLKELNVPLYVETVHRRCDVPSAIIKFCHSLNASHVYANIEYEVDELRREAKLVTKCLDQNISFNLLSDTCVVEPGSLSSKSGNQYTVYTPWFRSWVAYLNANPSKLKPFSTPEKVTAKMDEKIKKLFDNLLVEIPPGKRLSESQEAKRLSSMWPAGEEEGMKRLETFLHEKVKGYADHRNYPDKHYTSELSVYLAAGTLSARTAIVQAQKAGSSRLDNGNEGVRTWISEIAWREFYRHVMVHWPHVWYVPALNLTIDIFRVILTFQ